MSLSLRLERRCLPTLAREAKALEDRLIYIQNENSRLHLENAAFKDQIVHMNRQLIDAQTSCAPDRIDRAAAQLDRIKTHITNGGPITSSAIYEMAEHASDLLLGLSGTMTYSNGEGEI